MPRGVRPERNVRFFREVNERIRELEAHWVSSEPIGFICECTALGCCAPVYLTVDEFLEVRTTVGHFIARPDHLDPANERVLHATDRYVVLTQVEAPARPAGSGVGIP